MCWRHTAEEPGQVPLRCDLTSYYITSGASNDDAGASADVGTGSSSQESISENSARTSVEYFPMGW
jgi:hypothetical protein